MARFMKRVLRILLLLVLAAVSESARTPPGIANNPSQARCMDPSYKECHNLVHVCPKFCPDSCTVHCQSCKPICGTSTSPPDDSDSPSTPSPSPTSTPSYPPTTSPTPSTSTPPPSPPTPTPSTPSPTSPSGTSTNPPTTSPTPPTRTPSSPAPPTPSTPSPSPPTSSPSSPSPPSPSTPSPSPPTITPSSPSPSPSSAPTPPTTPPSSPSPESPPSPSTPSPAPPPTNIPSSPPPSPSSAPTPPTSTPSSPSPESTPSPSTPSPAPPPTSIPSSPSPSPSSAPTPPTSTPSSPSPESTPSPSTPSPYPPTSTPSSSSPPSSTPPTPNTSTPSSPSPESTPSPSTPFPSPPTSTPSSLSPPSSTPPTPNPRTPSSPSPPSGSEVAGEKRVRCRNKNYSHCYNVEHVCPSSCPGGCMVDCVTCKPVCNCDRPGAVCQDPRFIGGDGITFYFHGKKDHDFCLLADSNLHINAHFIGKRNEKMTRDFTWVQSIAILFNNHQLYIGALKTSTWDDSVDRLAVTFDGEPVTLTRKEGTEWQSTSIPTVSITRVTETNNIIIEVEGGFRITAKVVPITEEDSRIHNYGIAEDDCFAHLDLGFKFYSLSNEVNGVLGQTYRTGYVSRVNVGAKMPIIGGDKDFRTSSLFAADCAVARFKADESFYAEGSMQGLELPSLRCRSGIDGQGVVCKR